MGEGASDGQRTAWQELVLSFHHGDSGSQILVIGLGDKRSCQLSHH